MSKPKSKPGDDGPKRKPRRARSLLSPDEIRDLAERSSEKLDPLRFYLRADYNQELDLRNPSLAVLLEAEFGLSRGEVGALTLTKIDGLLGQVHRYKSARTPEERQRVLAEVAELRTKLANLPNPSPGEAAVLKALDWFPTPGNDEEDPGGDWMTSQEARDIFGMTAVQLTRACQSGGVDRRGTGKRQLVHGGKLMRHCLQQHRRYRRAVEG
jgi:hypothetical protein